jgi:hypothetical protein
MKNPDADPDLAAARRVYAGLTRAYPHSFRQAYGPLMLQLFCDQYRAAHATPGRGEMARFWLRTLGDLAASVLREQADELRRATMYQERMSSTMLGVLLFVLMGAAVLLMDAPVPAELHSTVNIGGIVLWFCGYLLVLGLLLKGWLAGFPRWVYPYLGYALIFPLYIALVTTPDLVVFGIPVWGKEQWGWRACVPLGVMVLLALRLSRPLGDNLARLVRNVWEDWTLAVFTLFGLLPMVVFISLDEVERSFAFWPKFAGLAIILAGVFLYMRLAHPSLRFLALVACAFLAVAVMAGSSHYYWQTHDVNLTTGVRVPRAGPVDWGALLYAAASEAGRLLLILLLPLPLALARRVYMRIRSRRLSLP